MPLIIKKEHISEILKHAESEMPNEACGVIAGTAESKGPEKEKTAKRIYKCKNAFKSPYRYKIVPDELIAIFKEVEESSLEILGFYHSHPFKESFLEPSMTDKAEALWDEASYIIVSPRHKAFASWLLSEKGFKREEVILRA